MRIFLCDDDLESILCAVYSAWMSRLGHDNVRIELKETYVPQLFCEYEETIRDSEKSTKVTDAVRCKISDEVYEQIYKAALSTDTDKADKIYRYLIYAFKYGAKIINMLQIKEVCDIFEICRYVGNEAHLTLEFMRFSKLSNRILIGKTGPRNDVITIIAPYFADRMPGENWIIYDVNRHKAVVHKADGPWFVTDADDSIWRFACEDTDEEKYEELWTAFFKSIAIKERTNPVCQMTHLPLHYRKYMTEFENNGKI